MPIYALHVATRDAAGNDRATVTQHFAFDAAGRAAAEAAMQATPNAGYDGPVEAAAYPLGHTFSLND